MADPPERWRSPFTQVEMRKLWTYSDDIRTVKAYRCPDDSASARAGSWLLVNQETEPGPNTVAEAGPTQGGLLLFKMSSAVYSNRPLTLWILGPGNRKLGGISLNL